MKHSTWEKQGFTLIELLVVIAIIAILATILLPSLNKARMLAKNVACKSKLRTIFMGARLYGSDNDGQLPPMWDPDGYNNLDQGPWPQILEWNGYVDADYPSEFYQCPMDEIVGKYTTTSYGINAIITDPYGDAGCSWLKYEDVVSPSKVYLFMEGIREILWWRYPQFVQWRHSPYEGDLTITAPLPYGGNYDFDCSGQCYISYVDGHIGAESFGQTAYSKDFLPWNGIGDN